MTPKTTIWFSCVVKPEHEVLVSGDPDLTTAELTGVRVVTPAEYVRERARDSDRRRSRTLTARHQSRLRPVLVSIHAIA